MTTLTTINCDSSFDCSTLNTFVSGLNSFGSDVVNYSHIIETNRNLAESARNSAEQARDIANTSASSAALDANRAEVAKTQAEQFADMAENTAKVTGALFSQYMEVVDGITTFNFTHSSLAMVMVGGEWLIPTLYTHNANGIVFDKGFTPPNGSIIQVLGIA